MATTFDVSKLTANMANIRARVAQNGKRRAVFAGATVIAEAMASATPVLIEKNAGSDALDPGTVKANTKARTTTEDGEPIGLAGPNGLGGKVGKVAHLVEYGHQMVTGGQSRLGADGLLHGGGTVHDEDVAPHPWLRPAFEATSRAALEAVGVTLGKEMAEAVTG